VNPVNAEVYLAPAFYRVCDLARRALQFRHLRLSHGAVGDQVIVNDLDGRVESEGILPLVGLVEATLGLDQFLSGDLTGGERDFDGVLLARVAHVSMAVEDQPVGPHPVAFEVGDRLRSRLLEEMPDLLRRDGVQSRHLRAEVVPPEIGA
jgi:hypothetical protein